MKNTLAVIGALALAILVIGVVIWGGTAAHTSVFEDGRQTGLNEAERKASKEMAELTKQFEATKTELAATKKKEETSLMLVRGLVTLADHSALPPQTKTITICTSGDKKEVSDDDFCGYGAPKEVYSVTRTTVDGVTTVDVVFPDSGT